MDVIHCPACDAQAAQGMDRFEVQIGARRVVVESERMRCDACGETFFTPDQMDAAQVAASTQIRRDEDLLQPPEIRAIRYKFGLSQSGLERILSAGPKTAVRWERGTVFQNKTTDELLRLLRDVPGVFEHLALRKGMVAAELFEPAPSNPEAGDRQRFGAEIVEDSPGVINLTTWSKKQKSHRVEPDAELPPFPEEAIK